MNPIRVIMANIVRRRARLLRLRLAPSPDGTLPIFRDRTLTWLQAAVTEALKHLAETPLAKQIQNLDTALCGITADDIRRSKFLREEILFDVQRAERELTDVLASMMESKNEKTCPPGATDFDCTGERDGPANDLLSAVPCYRRAAMQELSRPEQADLSGPVGSEKGAHV
jgi:hypothetical protein